MVQKVSLLTLAAILFCLQGVIQGVIQGVGPLGLLIVMRRMRRNASVAA
jgi:hypothetical protein